MLKERTNKTILLLLIVTELIVVLFSGLSNSESGVVCLTDTKCSIVQSSIYGSILGYPVAKVGIFAFSIYLVIYLLVLFKKLPAYTFLTASIFGALFAVYFLVIQAFVLKAFCSSCLVIDILMLVITGFAFWTYRRNINN